MPAGRRSGSGCGRASACASSGELDLVAVGGGEIIHTRDELLAEAYGVDPLELRLRRPSDFFIEYPAVWHAVGIPFDFDAYEARVVREALAGREYVAVRDERSRTRLVAAGVTGEIAVVPDSAFLLDRLFPPETLGAVCDGLRAAAPIRPRDGRWCCRGARRCSSMSTPSPQRSRRASTWCCSRRGVATATTALPTQSPTGWGDRSSASAARARWRKSQPRSRAARRTPASRCTGRSRRSCTACRR